MANDELAPVWLFLHVIAAILGFGPTFAAPMFGVMVRKHPEHAQFGLALQQRISTGIVLPVAITMLISGIGLIISANISLLRTPWLSAGLALYLLAMADAIFILRPTLRKALGIVTGAPPPTSHSPGSGPAKPSPEFPILIRRLQIFGTLNHVFVVVIVFLMVVKPGGVVRGPIFG